MQTNTEITFPRILYVNDFITAAVKLLFRIWIFQNVKQPLNNFKIVRNSNMLHIRHAACSKSLQQPLRQLIAINLSTNIGFLNFKGHKIMTHAGASKPRTYMIILFD